MDSFRNKTFRGEFWSSTSPALKGNGHLSIDDLGHAKLSIDGPAGLANGFAKGAIDYTVHGEISADYPYAVSLFHCFANKVELPFRSTGAGFSADVTCRTMLIGAHVADTWPAPGSVDTRLS